MIDRNKKELFLIDLEEWIKEVIAINGNVQNKEIATRINDGFDRSMQANIDYHTAAASALGDDEGNSALVLFHTQMSDVYRSLLEKKR